jgi:hypothetical protein
VCQQFDGLPQRAELRNSDYRDGSVQVNRWGTQYFHGIDGMIPGNKASGQQTETIPRLNEGPGQPKRPADGEFVAGGQMVARKHWHGGGRIDESPYWAAATMSLACAKNDGQRALPPCTV